MRVLVLSFLTLSVAGLASSQPAPTTPRARPLAAGLTSDEARKVQRRLKDYAVGLRLHAVRAEALRQAGLSRDNDALEAVVATATLTAGPVHVGFLQPVSPAVATSDPGLAATNRSMLRARLGREPSPAELESERRAFDARIAQVNRALARQRPQIARAVRRDGAFSSELDASILGVRPTDPHARSAEAQEGIRALMQMLLTR